MMTCSEIDEMQLVIHNAVKSMELYQLESFVVCTLEDMWEGKGKEYALELIEELE